MGNMGNMGGVHVPCRGVAYRAVLCRMQVNIGVAHPPPPRPLQAFLLASRAPAPGLPSFNAVLRGCWVPYVSIQSSTPFAPCSLAGAPPGAARQRQRDNAPRRRGAASHPFLPFRPVRPRRRSAWRRVAATSAPRRCTGGRWRWRGWAGWRRLWSSTGASGLRAQGLGSGHTALWV
jgi:hypothetical protein